MLSKNHWLNIFVLKNILVIFFSYDFIVKIIVHFTQISAFYNYVIVFKFIIVLCFLVFYGIDKSHIKLMSTVVALSSAYLIGQVYYFEGLSIDQIFFSGYYFLSSITPILFIIFCYDIEKKLVFIQLKRWIIFMAASSICIFIGFLFNVEIFTSYFRGGERFGYSGFLLYHHEAGYIIFLLLALLYYNLKQKGSQLNIALFVVVLLASFLIGTKKALFLTILLLIYILFENLKKERIYSYYFLGFIIAFIFFHKSLFAFFLKFNKIYQRDGFWSSFLSYRNILFEENYFPYVTKDFSLTKFLFGWPIFRDYRTEMELLDLLLFFGITGIIVYIIFFRALLSGRNKLSYFIIICLILAALASGNLLASVNVMILLFLILRYINKIGNHP